MQLTSPAFKPGAAIPIQHTGHGEDLSPPLKWTEVPAGTQSFVLIVEKRSMAGERWGHWLAWNIPGAARSLEAAVPKVASLPDGMQQGTNDFGQIGYAGPCPPSGGHRYFFMLYALGGQLDLPATTIRAELTKAMKAHVIGRAELMGIYVVDRQPGLAEPRSAGL